MTAVLSTILRDVRARLAERRAEMPLEELRDLAAASRAPGDFLAALKGAAPAVIAEVKRKSPSMGDIAAGVDPVAVARAYVGAGAAALSVLTERDHFAGAPEVLTSIRAALPETPLLMKDFVVDVSQLYEETGVYLAEASRLGLTALVEVHDEAEMAIAKRAGARLLGINNRNLKTMDVDLATGIALAREAPGDALLVAESGIATGADVKRLAAAGFGAYLIGTSLMRGGEPGRALATLRREAVS